MVWKSLQSDRKSLYYGRKISFSRNRSFSAERFFSIGGNKREIEKEKENGRYT